MTWYHRQARAFPVVIAFTLMIQCVGLQRENQGPTKAYVQNRVMDARDVLSVTGGYFGFGAWVDASVLSIGLGGQFDPALFSANPSNVQRNAQNRSRGGGNSFGLNDGEMGSHNEARAGLILLGVEQSQPVDHEKRIRSNVRRKGGNRLAIPLNRNYADYTNVGVNVCLFLCIHVEANPGELVDLLFGIAGFDIYDDDVYHAGAEPIGEQNEIPIKEDIKEILE